MSCAVKRGFESMEGSPEHAAVAGAFPSPSILFSKRCRFLPTPDASQIAQAHHHQQQQQHQQHAAAAAAAAHTYHHCTPLKARNNQNPDSPFHPRSAAASVEKYIPHGKRRRMKQQQQQQHAATAAPDMPVLPDMPPPADVVFTLAQVRSIVEKAVQEREQEITALYDQILADRLTEQFNMFTKFNEDYLHRQMKQSNFSYMS